MEAMIVFKPLSTFCFTFKCGSEKVKVLSVEIC